MSFFHRPDSLVVKFLCSIDWGNAGFFCILSLHIWKGLALSIELILALNIRLFRIHKFWHRVWLFRLCYVGLDSKVGVRILAISIFRCCVFCLIAQVDIWTHFLEITQQCRTSPLSRLKRLLTSLLRRFIGSHYEASFVSFLFDYSEKGGVLAGSMQQSVHCSLSLVHLLSRCVPISEHSCPLLPYLPLFPLPHCLSSISLFKHPL